MYLADYLSRDNGWTRQNREREKSDLGREEGIYYSIKISHCAMGMREEQDANDREKLRKNVDISKFMC